MTGISSFANCLLVLFSATPVIAFQPHHPILSTHPSRSGSSSSTPPLTIIHLSENNNPKETLSEEEDDLIIGAPTYKSDIDWDAEWKKVVDNVDQPKDRPKDPSPLEMRANVAKSKVKRVKGQVARNVFDASEEMKRQVEGVRLPSFTMLQGDWRVS